MILLETTPQDKESLLSIGKKLDIDIDSINVKLSVYKNRRGSWKGIYLWMRADRGTCRFEPLFCTDWNYVFKEMVDLKINVKKPIDISAF